MSGFAPADPGDLRAVDSDRAADLRKGQIAIKARRLGLAHQVGDHLSPASGAAVDRAKPGRHAVEVLRPALLGAYQVRGSRASRLVRLRTPG
jgi:hypothetical protein